MVSDVTEGSAGNQERMAFLFDRRKIRFSGVAGEIVIPPIEDHVVGAFSFSDVSAAGSGRRRVT